jgi:hypothetical protein
MQLANGTCTCGFAAAFWLLCTCTSAGLTAQHEQGCTALVCAVSLIHTMDSSNQQYCWQIKHVGGSDMELNEEYFC